MRHFLIFILFLYSSVCFAQPVISSVSPARGAVGSVVTITGNNFDNIASNITIYFGAAKATPSAASKTSLTVEVPVGATYGRISVSTGAAVCFSPQPFNVVGGQALTDSSFNSKVDFKADAFPSIIARGDFDGDGKPDMVVANYTSSDMSVFRNTSSSGVVSFSSAVNYTTNIEPGGVDIDDINGDGRPDIVVSSISGHTFSVFINSSTVGTISFLPRVDISPGILTWPRRLAVADIDGDGNLDVITSDNNKIYDLNGGAHGTFSVNINTGTTGSVSFAMAVTVNTDDYPRGICAGDLDGDGKPDIALTSQETNTVSVFLNGSTTGNIVMTPQQTMPIGGNGEQVIMGDVDGDGKQDLIVTNINGSDVVSVFRNTSTIGSISFAPPISIPTGSPLGVSVGDMDGDGKPDIAVANYSTGKVSVLINTSSLASISFAPKLDFPVAISIGDVRIGDVDGDLIPDLTVTDVNDGLVSVLIKKPVQFNNPLRLGNDTTICQGDSLTVKVNVPGSQYLWNTGDTTDHITVKTSGQYFVITPINGRLYYDTINIQVAPKPSVFFGTDTSMCGGGNILLNALNAGATYVWSNGSTDPSISVSTAGTYSVTINQQGCIQIDTVNVKYDSLPSLQLDTAAFLCAGQTLVLEPKVNSGNFVWQDGSTSPTYNVSTAGQYSVTVTNTCGTTSGSVKVSEGDCNSYFPTAFTPNHDGANDVFRSIIYGQVSSFHMQIFDRWGRMVFQSENVSNGWDGKVNGKDAAAGTYVWSCTYTISGKSLVNRRGTVILVR